MKKMPSVLFLLLAMAWQLYGLPKTQAEIGHEPIPETVDEADELFLFMRSDTAIGTLEMGLPVARELTEPIETWLLWMLLVQLLGLGMVRYLFPPLVPQLVRTITNYNIALQRFRHSDKEPAAVDLILRVNALVTFSLMISLSLQFYFAFPFGWQPVTIVGIFLLAFYFFRKLIKYLVGSIFRFGEELSFVNFYSDYLIKGLGMASYPLLILFLFGSTIFQYGAFYLFILILIIFIIARFLRGLKAGTSLILGSSFHFILYICTLEIMPILLICKLFVMYYGSI